MLEKALITSMVVAIGIGLGTAAFSASFLDQSTGFTTSDATETIIDTKAGYHFQVGALPIRIASMEFYSNMSNGESPPVIYVTNDTDTEIVSQCIPYSINYFAYLNKCDFIELPTLQPGTEYRVYMYADTASYDYFYKSLTNPISNTYLTWGTSTVSTARDPGITKLIIIPGDQVTVMPGDEFEDYWDFQSNILIVIGGLVIFLLAISTILNFK